MTLLISGLLLISLSYFVSGVTRTAWSGFTDGQSTLRVHLVFDQIESDVRRAMIEKCEFDVTEPALDVGESTLVIRQFDLARAATIQEIGGDMRLDAEIQSTNDLYRPLRCTDVEVRIGDAPPNQSNRVQFLLSPCTQHGQTECFLGDRMDEGTVFALRNIRWYQKDQRMLRFESKHVLSGRGVYDRMLDDVDHFRIHLNEAASSLTVEMSYRGTVYERLITL